MFAHTSPVYIDVLGHALDGSSSARSLLDWLWRLNELIRPHGQFTNDTQRDQVIALIERARGYYQARATRSCGHVHPGLRWFSRGLRNRISVQALQRFLRPNLECPAKFSRSLSAC